jgi:hypothetical protein
MRMFQQKARFWLVHMWLPIGPRREFGLGGSHHFCHDAEAR